VELRNGKGPVRSWAWTWAGVDVGIQSAASDDFLVQYNSSNNVEDIGLNYAQQA
jgi:hypothetical protein